MLKVGQFSMPVHRYGVFFIQRSVEKDFYEYFYSVCNQNASLQSALNYAITAFKTDVDAGVYGSQSFITSKRAPTSTSYLGWDQMILQGDKNAFFVEPD